MPDGVRALGEVAGDVLHRLVRELLSRKTGGHLVESRVDRLELRLPLVLRGPEADPAAFADEVVVALDRLLDDAIQQAAAFRPGHAFCHRCGQVPCEHSSPPSPRHVFVGYGPTGTPQWTDFAQFCLDQRHPEVDRLYDDRPALLTWVQTGAEVRERLLDVYRSPGYDVKGQLMAGFLSLTTAESEGRGVLALTFQVAASTTRGGRRRLGLNILGAGPGGEDLGTLAERFRQVPWQRPVRWGQSALSTLGARSANHRRGRTLPEDEIDRRVEGILRGIARRLERDLRGRTRRTRHAERRHESGERPTRKAVEDIREARPGAFLVDEKTGAVVVLGDRGRTHFFSVDGRLVSSVRYSRDAIVRKRKSGLWRKASSDEIDDLRGKLLEG
jgi:hypothetical protein